MSRDEVLSLLSQALSDNGHVRTLPIHASWEEDHIRLTGRVYSYFQKQIIIAVCLKCLAGNPFKLDLSVVPQEKD